MEQENKEQQTNEPAIHRGEWLVFGFGAFVVSGLIALMLQLNVPDAPIYPVILAGGLLMMFGFMRSAKPRETLDPGQPEKSRGNSYAPGQSADCAPASNSISTHGANSPIVTGAGAQVTITTE